MAINTRFGAGLIAIALIASACGGGSEVASDQEALLEELEAQVEELQAEAEERDAAAVTTAPPATVPDDPVEEVAEPEPAEPAEEPVEAETAPAEEVAEPEAEEPADAAVTTVSGDAINPSMGFDAVAALMDTILGPTTDLPAQTRRIDSDFPNLSTLPDTEITQFMFNIRWDFRDEEWDKNTTVEFFTTASPEDAVLAYQTEFAVLFPEDRVSSSVQQQDELVFHVASVGTNRVVAREFEGLTFVSIDYWQHVASPEVAAAYGGLEAETLGYGEGTFNEVAIRHFGNSRTIDTSVMLMDVSEDDLTEIEADLADAAGWTLVDDPADEFRDYSSPDISPVITVHGADRTFISPDESIPWIMLSSDLRYS